MSKFTPKMYYQDIFHINYALLKEKKIKVLIFDLDNTIIKIGDDLPSQEVVDLFSSLSKDFTLLIASNNIKPRVRRIGNYLGIHSFYSTLKPTKRLKRLLIKELDNGFNEMAIIGDQIVTDIYLGNKLNIYSILVDPMGDKDMFVTYFNRWLEKRIMKRIKLKRGGYYEEDQVL